MLLSILTSLSALSPALLPDDPARRVARALRTATPPVIDGRLDEAVWAETNPIGELVQVEPVEGATPSEATDVRFLFDDDHLYVGLRFHDSQPGEIISTTRERDAFLSDSDFVEMIFDTFHDRRNSFFFQINPTGSKGDALVTNNGSNFNKPWDGIWEGKARIDDRGWTAELAIPFKTLNFKQGLDTWGFNIARHIGRKREISRWTGASRDHGIFEASLAGDLTGLEGLQQGLGLDVAPFVVGDWINDRLNRREVFLGDVGLDALYKVTPSLNLTVTVNTDFAESEVDERRVNLTRFPLFFPERRDFFLQDSGLFQFIGPDGAFVPFFSRTIGLSGGGEEVPILAGAKLTGRIGDYDLGALNVVTDRFTDSTGGSVGEQNLAVARVVRNFGEKSTVGVLVTDGDPSGATEDTTYGLDLNYGTSRFRGDKNLNAGAWFMRDDSDAASGNDTAFGARVNSFNDEWDWQVSAKEIGRNFSPPLGFVPRNDSRQYVASLTHSPRMGEVVRRLEFSAFTQVITDTSDDVETLFTEIQPFGIEWENGTSFRIETEFIRENLSQPFAINGVTIPADDFELERYRLEVDSPRKADLSVGAEVETGTFFGGDRDDVEVSLLWRPGALFNGELEYEVSEVSLPGGDFDTQVARARFNFSFTPDLSWNNFIQWDNVSDIIGINSRLRWIPTPGTNFFLVVNETFLDDGSTIIPTSQGISAKFVYTLRF